MKKRPAVLLIALIIGILCCIVTWSYMSDSASKIQSMDKSGEAAGTAIAIALATPHAVLATLATIFCALAWIFSMRWSAITAGVLYAVAMALMIPWFYFVIVQMILCFVGAHQLNTPQGGSQP